MEILKTSDSLEFLKSIKEYDNDIIYCDPPYALGSEVIIRKDGKVDYAKANDFMNKWDMPTGDYWEKWFNEAYRTLKHGGWLIMFGMDRQLLLFKYYAHLAGFEEQQSLYWYFISNFPKATDLSKMIDKNAGAKREIVGEKKSAGFLRDKGGGDGWAERIENKSESNIPELSPITTPSTDLAKKYDGYKYSISPLKQTNETIMVFQKPTKTGSPLHDTLAFENGDDTITVGAINIDGNRVGTNDNLTRNMNGTNQSSTYTMNKEPMTLYGHDDGRYPAQTFIDEQTAEVLDKQSGISKSQVAVKHNSGGLNFGSETPKPLSYDIGYDDIGGCSKILHKCKFEQDDMDLYNYEPKVSGYERNAGCDNFEEKMSANLPMRSAEIESDNIANDGTKTHRETTTRNNHPTLKPIALNEKILKLFKTPNDQKICYPFAGAGSEIIGGIKAGFDNWHGCEISQEYVDIANARIAYWKETMHTQTDIFDFI